MNEIDINEGLETTGFTNFTSVLNSYLTQAKQFVSNHFTNKISATIQI